ncbi:MAG: hypothetical protein R2755_20145 [Acidimicrobiales bacterium]
MPLLRDAGALPVDAVLDEVVGALRQRRRVVVTASPGSGKTTRVPLAVADALANGVGAGSGPGRVLVLEPRRVAARAMARFLAARLGDPVGATIGLSTRDERLVGPATRIELITEGVLTRRLQRDPELPGVAAVLFDEFHERSLVADTGLALTLDVADGLRPDLWVGVLSATIDAAAVAALLGDAPVVNGGGAPTPCRSTTGHGRRATIPPSRRPRWSSRRCAPTPAMCSPSCPGWPRSGAAPTGCETGWAARWTCTRCTGSFGPRSRIGRWPRHRRDGAGWCWPPTWPRPASPSPACRWWWTAAWCDERSPPSPVTRRPTPPAWRVGPGHGRRDGLHPAAHRARQPGRGRPAHRAGRAARTGPRLPAVERGRRRAAARLAGAGDPRRRPDRAGARARRLG